MMLEQLQAAGVVDRDGRDIPWSLSFGTDLERIYTDELRSRGHHPKPGTSLSELGRTFHQLVRARLEHLQGRPLSVRLSREMEPNRARPAIVEIERRATQGEPLWPYLSKQTEKAGFRDDLLSHWGIVHFHLGEELQDSGYIERTGDHLYAWIRDDTAYFLDIRNHAFADQRVVDVIVRNWPELLEPFRIQAATGEGTAAVPGIVQGNQMRRFSRTTLIQNTPRMSPGETTALRDAGVTPTFVSETGARYSPPGAGASCAGTGNDARVRDDYESWWAGQLADVVVAELDQLLGHIERTQAEQVRALNFHIEDLEALRVAAVAERESKIRFNFPMTFDRDLDPAEILAPIIAAVSRNP